MKLSVPCNWDPQLLDNLSSIPEVYEMFGACHVTPVGGGRPSAIIKNAPQVDVEEYVRAVRKIGWSFNYVLNAPCMGNMEYDVKTHRELLSHLEWLCMIGVDTVTVTIPYLIEIIKKQFPTLRIKASTIAGVNTLTRANYYKDLGVDEVTLDFMANRDFALLERLSTVKNLGIVLLVNDLCLYQCPYRAYHYNACGHASQQWHPLQSYYFDYSTSKCQIDKIKDPTKIIQSRWIRPEDLGDYELLGYDRFKISGRDMPTERILSIVKAYARRTYSGNLLMLFSPYIDESDTTLPSIDNRSLDGFLTFFQKGGCSDDCNNCGYCNRIAKKAVKVDNASSQKRLGELEEFVEKLVYSKFVPGKR